MKTLRPRSQRFTYMEADNMIKAVLFDLDGTLLPMNTEAFIAQYTKSLAPKVSHIVEPEIFLKALWSGTEAMMKNKEKYKTNEQVFTETFLPLINKEKEEIWPALNQFYEEEFPKFAPLTAPVPEARKVVEAALKKGYKVAVATNPVFPSRAIEHRLEWAGVKDLPIDLVTVYENSSYTKPHREYYEWIAGKLGVQPEECIMAGNDKQEDMAASTAGMTTYLVEGHVIDRGNTEFPIHDQGTLAHLKNHIEQDTGIFEEKK
jgi:FMN phosphatase YigB (HAD superfamily)